MKAPAFYFSLAALAAVFSGCASYGLHHSSTSPVTQMRTDERRLIAGSTVESHDIATLAEKMAHEILFTPEIANAKGVPRIVLLPLKNDSRFPVNKEMFLERIITLLNEKSAGKVRFQPRDRVELDKDRDFQQSGRLPGSTDPAQFKGADFMLAGRLVAARTGSPAGISDSVLYSFTLIDPNTSDIVCKKSHEMKKQGLESVLYR